MAKRGMITDEIKRCSHELLGYEIDCAELRLMPYVQYVMMNEQRVDPIRMKPNERKILSKWREMNFIEGGASGMIVSKAFWDALHEILWLGYVDID